MKRSLLFSAVVVMMTAISSMPAYSRIVRKPPFEARKSSVVTIEEINLGKDATRVKFHAVFRPNWWIQVDSTEYIADTETGQEYYPIGSEGITLGEKCWMPKSGDTTYTVIYPPLPDNVSVIDFSPEGSWTTWGIRLDGKEIERAAGAATPGVVIRAHEELPTFFTRGDVRIHGAIKNYDTRLDFENMALYVDDIATGNDIVRSIAIRPDGTFDETLQLTSPITAMLSAKGVLMDLYLEPGNDLQIITDWEKMLEVDRMRGLKPQIDDVEFGGSLAEINNTLYRAPYQYDADIYNMAQSIDPLKAKEMIDSCVAEWREKTDKYAAERDIAPELKPYLDRRIEAKRYGDLLDYMMYRLYFRRSQPNDSAYQHPIPKEYYAGFLPDLLKADTLLLGAKGMAVVLNRLGFDTMEDALDITFDRNAKSSPYESAAMAQAVTEYAGTADVPFMWQMALAARQGSYVRMYARWDKDQTRKTLDNMMKSAIKDKYLTRRLNDLYDTTVNYEAKSLPDTEAGKLMKRLLEPYTGKWVIVDFWGTTCGPCRANIERTKEFREANRDNQKFTHLFLTSSEESPKGAYDEYVAANLAGDHCKYLTPSDMIGLRGLFDISAIPHYVLFDPEGRVADPDFSIYQIASFLNQTGIEFITPESDKKP